MKEIISTLGINFDLIELNSIETELPFCDEEEEEEEESEQANISNDSTNQIGTDILAFHKPQSGVETTNCENDDRGETPKILFNCQFCDKGFTVSIGLSKHVQKHFAELDPDLDPTRPSNVIDLEIETMEVETESDESFLLPTEMDENERVEILDNTNQLKEMENQKDICNVVSENLNEVTDDEMLQYVGVSCDFCDELFCRKNIDEHKTGCDKNPQKENYHKDPSSETQSSNRTTDTSNGEITVKREKASDNINLNKETDETMEAISKATDNGDGKRKEIGKQSNHTKEKTNDFITADGNIDTRMESKKCFLCGLVCSTKNAMHRHLAVIHYGTVLEEKYGPFNYACHLCPISLAAKSNWMQHLVSVHRLIPFLEGEKATEQKSERTTSDNDKAEKQDREEAKTGEHENKILSSKKNSVTKSLLNIKCFKCQKSFQGKQGLVRHMADVHYKQKLTEKFGPFNSLCTLCDEKFATERTWLNHLLAIHKVFPTIEGFQTEEIKPANRRFAKKAFKINSKKNKKSMKTRKLAINKIKVKQEEMDEIKSCKIDSKYYCPKCPRSAAKYQNLLSHLSLVHFKEILKPQLKPDLTCGVCQKSFSVEHHAIYHLASSHNALLNHIPVKELLQIKTN